MLETLKDTATVWVFQSSHKLTSDQKGIINNALNSFIPNWAAHGVSLKADFEIVKDVFVVIGVDEDSAQASGCSKDALTREIKAIGETINIDFFDRMKTAFINSSGDIELCDMLGFKTLVSDGKISQKTIVFNNLVTSKIELLKNWETTVSNSWHANLMSLN